MVFGRDPLKKSEREREREAIVSKYERETLVSNFQINGWRRIWDNWDPSKKAAT